MELSAQQSDVIGIRGRLDHDTIRMLSKEGISTRVVYNDRYTEIIGFCLSQESLKGGYFFLLESPIVLRGYKGTPRSLFEESDGRPTLRLLKRKLHGFYFVSLE
jgi:hypothetical protein